jgi:hypothetical protein
MAVFAAIFSIFAVAIIICMTTKSEGLAWLVSSATLPIYVTLSEFFIEGGSSGFWPIPLITGTIVSAAVGGAGVAVASWFNHRSI